MEDTYINRIINDDCIVGLQQIADNTIDACLTDPPYNYEFAGHKWDAEEIERRLKKASESKTILIKNMPYGSGLSGGTRNARWYAKYQKNLDEYQEWCKRWGDEVYRVLKPGSFIAVFNSSRTIAHVQVALEKSGFFTKDILVWKKNAGIPKGLNFAKKLEKEGYSSEEWTGWHSALRNEWEAIVLLQKPLENNYLTTVKKYGVGLLKTEGEGITGFMSNIITNIQRDKKDNFNNHTTVKPVSIMRKLIQLTTPKNTNAVVLDPFMGSGTTAIAAIREHVNYLGFEVFESYCEIADRRIANEKKAND